MLSPGVLAPQQPRPSAALQPSWIERFVEEAFPHRVPYWDQLEIPAAAPTADLYGALRACLSATAHPAYEVAALLQAVAVHDYLPPRDLPIGSRADLALRTARAFAAVATMVTGPARKTLVEAGVRYESIAHALRICPATTQDELRSWVEPGSSALYPALFPRDELPQGSAVSPPSETPDSRWSKVIDALEVERGYMHGTSPSAEGVRPVQWPVCENYASVAGVASSPELDRWICKRSGERAGEVRARCLAWFGFRDHRLQPLREKFVQYMCITAFAAAHARTGRRWTGRRADCLLNCNGCRAGLEHMTATRAIASAGGDLGRLLRFAASPDEEPDSRVAGVVAEFFPAVACSADYQAAGLYCEKLPCPSRDPATPAEFHISPEVCKALFSRGDTPSKRIAQLTLTTVYTVLGRGSLGWEVEYLHTNLGEPEWAVAGVLMVLLCVPEGVRRSMVDDMGWHRNPISSWSAHYKDWLTALRRCGRVWDAVDSGPRQWAEIRKVLSVCSRNMAPAEWEPDMLRRTINTPVHFAVDERGMLDANLWRRRTARHTARLVQGMVENTINTSVVEGVQDWWDARWGHSPSGSSSLRHLIKPVVLVDERLSSATRPSKKAVAEQLPDDFAVQMLARQPLIVARGSTKNEPGGRSRVLIAAGDPEYTVEAFASVHVEKGMNLEGIKARQTPDDVAQWFTCSLQTMYGETYLAMDYADFNTEHESRTMTMGDLEFAWQWHCQAGGTAAGRDKVIACLWVAHAQSNKWVSCPIGFYRAWEGLFSGDRNTARDNTLYHGVYSKTAEECARAYDAEVELRDPNYTGDDEDSKFNDWQAAFWYMAVHRDMGFVLKPAKQQRGEHEFLQRSIIDKSMPIRPLCASISMFSSGNWYQDVYLWYDSAVAAASDQVWDMVCRGMPIDFGRRLAVETINASMRVPTKDADGNRSWHRLEWWSYRHGNGTHPLWYSTVGDRLPPPEIAAKPAPAAGAMGAASAAWVAKKRREIDIPQQVDLAQYQEYCRKEGYASLYVADRAQAHREYALKHWPPRTSHIVLGGAPPPPREDSRVVCSLLLCNAGTERTITESEMLARMGLDKQLVAALGGIERAIPMLRPHLAGKYEQVPPPAVVPLAMRWEDPAIVSWYGRSTVGHDDLRSKEPDLVAKGWPRRCLAARDVDSNALLFIRAPNAAGKSTWVAAAAAAIDIDDVVTKLHLQLKVREESRTEAGMRPGVVAARVQDVVLRTGATALTSQMPASLVLSERLAGSGRICPVVVLPEPLVILRRMAERGWSTAQSKRRIYRWAAEVAAEVLNPPAWAVNGWMLVTSFDQIGTEWKASPADAVRTAIRNFVSETVCA